MPQVKRWRRFGWQGVSLDTPADWDLRQFHGTRKKGYVRLSDPSLGRAEMRWERPGRDARFEKLADRVVRQIEKTRTLDVDRHTGMVELDKKDTETFTCHPRRRGKTREAASYNLLSLCRECGRLVLLRIAFARGENIKRLTRKVFASLQDHSYDGTEVWAAYDLECAVPETVTLDQCLMYPGSTDFRFRRRHDRIDVGRIALASMILGRTSMEDWFKSFARKRFKKVRYTTEEAELKGHPGLVIRGRLRGLGALAPRLVFRQRYLCRLWHCEPSDKLYFYAVLAGSRNFDRFAALWDRVVCHA
jgi:hypothetical protein